MKHLIVNIDKLNWEISRLFGKDELAFCLRCSMETITLYKIRKHKSTTMRKVSVMADVLHVDPLHLVSQEG